MPDRLSPGAPSDRLRVVSASLSFVVAAPAEVAVQVAAADSTGRFATERLHVATDGSPPVALDEVRTPYGERIHVIRSDPGRLTVEYWAEIEVRSPGSATLDGGASPAGATGPTSRPTVLPTARPTAGFERQLYLRPSRYCPSDHLVGFSVAEFAPDTDVAGRVARITQWIAQRISYVPGSSDVHDSAEDTLLTGRGTCRDFAHLGIALCRATGIPARFAAVYAPGLVPMDFHAVFEAHEGGCWRVHDATRLAPRSSLVRIATGRDAADTAFATVTRGVADVESMVVTATTGGTLPYDDPSSPVELA